ncbi:nuclear transport factor 2 family protein [Lolliginicoccus levis]|uniref:nuclear transport factor 2 family protein n=1 Tax=Lolliginicoccus levis TaxID=2919542 RepID=UPI00241FEFFC|nr:nuclear transport factor 2 family protein [Lolliginicoccus levis]
MSTSDMATVLAWHEALNGRDLETLVDLSSDDVDIAAVDHASQGIAALREWASALTVTLSPGRIFAHDGVVVVEEHIAGSAPGDEAEAASAFRVVDDQVTSMFRHGTVEEALAATGLRESDLVDGG